MAPETIATATIPESQTPEDQAQQLPRQSRPKASAVWAVMVFMGAERVPGDADLASAAEADLAEMASAFSDPPPEFSDSPPDSLNLFVEMHRGGRKFRHQFGKKPLEPQAAGAAVAADLREFMKWALDEVKRSCDPQREIHVMLVLWGHAYEFEIGRSVTRSGVQGLNFKELARILQEFRTANGEPLVDIVGFDACDLSTIEIAYELRESARYLLASEIGIPMPGWPYNRIFKRIRHPYGREMGPAELGSYIVRRYCESYHADRAAVSLTLLDLRLASDIRTLTATLARRLAIAIGDDPEERDRVYDIFLRSRTIEDKPFVDVADLCLNLVRECGDVSVRAVAEEFGDFLIGPGPVTPGKSEEGEGRAFVVEHGRNACRAAKLHGVSLYAPHVANHDVDEALEFYDLLEITQPNGHDSSEKKTLWKELVLELLKTGS